MVQADDPFPPSELGQWRGLDRSGRRRWLRRAHDYHFEGGGAAKVQDRPPGAVFTIDGAELEDLEGFFCAIGEAINGPGGYFGASFSGFDDCLSGGFGLTAPCQIVWRGSAISRRRLSSAMAIEMCNEALAQIHERVDPADVEDYRAWLLGTIERASRGEDSIFDMIVSRIETAERRQLSKPGWAIELVLQ